jgi:dTDP-4-dehydrorhamnose reductase
MKILVLGASGMLGADVVAELKKSHEVIGLGRSQLDIRSYKQLELAINVVRPDLLIQCAAYTDVDKAEFSENHDELVGVNVHAVENLCRLCNKYNVKLIYPQTFLVLKEGNECHAENSRNFKPLGKYAQSKLEAESIIRKCMDIDEYMILRLGGFFGGGKARDKNFVGIFLNKILPNAINNQIHVIEIGNRVWQPTWTSDVARLVSHLIAGGEWQSNVQYSSNNYVTFAGLAQAILKIIGEDRVKIKEVSASIVEKGAKRPSSIIMSPSAALSWEWQNHMFEERLAEYLEYDWLK